MTARLSGVFRPATKQMFARPADPLSIALRYEILRNGIGVLALAFPIVMFVGGGLHHIQPSLSASYHFAPDAAGQSGAGTMRDALDRKSVGEGMGVYVVIVVCAVLYKKKKK